MKRDKTSLLAMLAAVVILGSVGIKSYFDYRLAIESRGAANGPETVSTPGEAPKTEAAGPAPGQSAAEADAIDRLPRSVLPPIPAEILNAKAPEPVPGAKKAPPAGTVAESSGPAPASGTDAETLRRETELFREKLNQLRGGANPANPGPPSPASAPAPATAQPGQATPLSALQAAITSPPATIPAAEPGKSAPVAGAEVEIAAVGGTAPAPATPQTEAEVAALNDQIRRQPAIARVISYDKDFSFLVMDGGSERNISVDMRLAVRRGTELLGFIKVVEVYPNRAIAELKSPNKNSPTARKPEAGDEVIAFNLF